MRSRIRIWIAFEVKRRIRIRIKVMRIHNTVSNYGALSTSVVDPDPPDNPDPYVFRPHGSGFGSINKAWIRILLSTSKNSKKNLDSYCFVMVLL
jgi:hypothetical protein